MTLLEIFDSDVDIEWKELGWGARGEYTHDGLPFVIELRKIALPELKGQRVAEVSFYRDDIAGDAAFGPTNQTPAPFVVYAAPMSALSSRGADWDAFYFSAEQRHGPGDTAEKRSHIYRALAHRAARRSGMTEYERGSPGREEFLVSTVVPSGGSWVDRSGAEV